MKKITALSFIISTKNSMMITIKIIQYQTIEKVLLAKVKISNRRINLVFHNKEVSLKTSLRTLVPDIVIQQSSIKYLQMMNIFTINKVGVYPMMQ